MQMRLSTDARNEIVVIRGVRNYLRKCCHNIFFLVPLFLALFPPLSPPGWPTMPHIGDYLPRSIATMLHRIGISD